MGDVGGELALPGDEPRDALGARVQHVGEGIDLGDREPAGANREVPLPSRADDPARSTRAAARAGGPGERRATTAGRRLRSRARRSAATRGGPDRRARTPAPRRPPCSRADPECARITVAVGARCPTVSRWPSRVAIRHADGPAARSGRAVTADSGRCASSRSSIAPATASASRSSRRWRPNARARLDEPQRHAEHDHRRQGDHRRR